MADAADSKSVGRKPVWVSTPFSGTNLFAAPKPDRISASAAKLSVSKAG